MPRKPVSREPYAKVSFRWPEPASRALKEAEEYLAKTEDLKFAQGEIVAIYFLKGWNAEKQQREKRTRKQLLKVSA